MDFIALLLTPFIYTNLTKSFLSIYQQQYYKTSRYIDCLIKKIDKKCLFKNLMIILGYSILTLCFIYFFKIPTYLIFLYTLITLMLLSTQKDNIIPLKYTNRIKRSYLTFYSLSLIVLLVFYYSFNKSNYIYLLFNIILLLCLSVIVSIVMILLSPIEYRIKKKYALKAKVTLLENKKLKTIGITGSYGKTSTKNILNTILSSKYSTLATPKSYNTPMGISNCVNNEKMYLYDYFIAELGIDEVKGMDKLLDIVQPDYAIITSIGPMHLKTLKSIDKITNEKMKLATFVSHDGFIVLNNDNRYIREFDKAKLKGKVITVGIDNDADIMAKNIVYTSTGSSFDVVTNNNTFNVTLPLLAKHNITNALCAIALSINLGVDIEKIKISLSSIKQVPHRLETNRKNNHLFIDDSYNSNYEGFSNALDVLSSFHDKRILITPGLIELGKYNREYNYKIAEKIVKSCDEVILVKNKSSMHIKERIRDLSTMSIVEVDSFFDATRYIKKEYDDDNAVILIENDLPDNYLN